MYKIYKNRLIEVTTQIWIILADNHWILTKNIFYCYICWIMLKRKDQTTADKQKITK